MGRPFLSTLSGVPQPVTLLHAGSGMSSLVLPGQPVCGEYTALTHCQPVHRTRGRVRETE